MLGFFYADVLRMEGSPTHIGGHLIFDCWLRVFPVTDTLVREPAHIVTDLPLIPGR